MAITSKILPHCLKVMSPRENKFDEVVLTKLLEGLRPDGFTLTSAIGWWKDHHEDIAVIEMWFQEEEPYPLAGTSEERQAWNDNSPMLKVEGLLADCLEHSTERALSYIYDDTMFMLEKE